MAPHRRASERVQEYVDRARSLNPNPESSCQAAARGQETHDSQADANVGAIPSVATNAPTAGATGAPTTGVTSTPMTDQWSPATQGDIHQLTGQVQHLVSVLQGTLPALLAGQATAVAAAAGQPGASSTLVVGTLLPPPPPRMTMREWQRLGLKTFSGLGGAIQADDWIRYMNKKFDTMVLTTQEKCLYASQQLVGEADLWWAEVRSSRGHLADPPTWEEFTSAFAIEYYPFSLTRNKEFELDALRQQDGELVGHYEKAFREICRFLPDVNRDDQKKAWRFINGLTQEMRHVLGAHNIRSYREAVDRAKAMEVQMRLTVAQKAGNQERKRSFPIEDKVEVGSSGSKKPKFHGKSKPSSTSSRHSKGGNRSFSPGASKGKLICYRCGDDHKGNECGFSGTCDFGGTRGHKAIVCKKNPKTILPTGLLNKFKASSGTANQLALTSPPETRREGGHRKMSGVKEAAYSSRGRRFFSKVAATCDGGRGAAAATRGGRGAAAAPRGGRGATAAPRGGSGGSTSLVDQAPVPRSPRVLMMWRMSTMRRRTVLQHKNFGCEDLRTCHDNQPERRSRLSSFLLATRK